MRLLNQLHLTYCLFLHIPIERDRRSCRNDHFLHTSNSAIYFAPNLFRFPPKPISNMRSFFLFASSFTSQTGLYWIRCSDKFAGINRTLAGDHVQTIRSAKAPTARLGWGERDVVSLQQAAPSSKNTACICGCIFQS